MMPRLLDLFCGAGGCSVGYARAGFEVIGVDHVPQPRYPFTLAVRDALETLEWLLAGNCIRPRRTERFSLADFDAIHASPPCQHYSAATKDGNRGNHPDLVASCRELLERTGKPWVIENVSGSPLSAWSAVLCGSMFGMRVRRHRLFEASFLLLAPPCRHAAQPVVLSVTGSGYGGKQRRNGCKPDNVVHAREVMGIDWPMTIAELSNAIPPAFTEFVGRQLLRVLAAGGP